MYYQLISININVLSINKKLMNLPSPSSRLMSGLKLIEFRRAIIKARVTLSGLPVPLSVSGWRFCKIDNSLKVMELGNDDCADHIKRISARSCLVSLYNFITS